MALAVLEIIYLETYYEYCKKNNIIVISGITSAEHFLLKMPALGVGEAGAIYKIIVKDISGVVDYKFFMVYSIITALPAIISAV